MRLFFAGWLYAAILNPCQQVTIKAKIGRLLKPTLSHPMSSLDKIINSAKAEPKHIVLPEATDVRIVEAACRATAMGIARVSLIGEPSAISTLADQCDCNLRGVSIIDPADCPSTADYQNQLLEMRKHKGLTELKAAELIQNPLVFGCMMVTAGDADGCVAGAITTTSEVVRSALQLIGMSSGNALVSSFFIIELGLPHQAINGTTVFADCALVIDPDASQLAHIAIASADSASRLLAIDPTVALLSFSTAGSAHHPNVDKVKEAGNTINNLRPDLSVMAEVQFDAAIIPAILEQKAPQIEINTPANVFVFPDLQSGNIGYKIAQRIGGAQAIGPILQGLKRPVNDLSRGCSVEDIINLIAVTAVQANQ